jgi:hypothetical protein
MSLRGIEAQPKDYHRSPTVCLDPDSKKDQLLSQDEGGLQSRLRRVEVYEQGEEQD